MSVAREMGFAMKQAALGYSRYYTFKLCRQHVSHIELNTDNNETRYVERSDGQTEHGRIFPAHFACDNCRGKKVE